ncbi:MAG: hypothetical protein V4668_01705, partial [Patescibacteria group bacterium]
MQGAFFYSSILAVASGIFVRSFFDVGWIGIAWGILMVVMVGSWWYKKRLENNAVYLLLMVVMLGSFMAGVARMEWAVTPSATSVVGESIGESVTLSGLVVAEPEVTAKSTRLTV